jgi:alpha-ribazole phosphatase
LSRLLLVRHGDTESNSAERYWGSTDVKLSHAGFRQAEKLRNRLDTERIDAIYSSNLSRASTTAEIIATSHQLDVITCTELREINFGELEGLTFNEINRLYPEVTELWLQRGPGLQYPGGESVAEFNSRVRQFMDRLKHAPQGTILVVAHSGSLRSLMCQLLGVGPEHQWQFRLDLASLSILETYPTGAILNLLNDVSHLQ